jgi:hypothetical protein
MPQIPRPPAEEVNALGALVGATQVRTAEDPEALPYNISFARYNDKECQITDMDANNAKAALMILRDVGIYFSSYENYAKYSGSAEVKRIMNDGDYSALYRGCDADEEIKEIKLVKEKKNVNVRLFYFTIESSKMFYLVAVRHTHIDTTKGNYQKKHSGHKKYRFGSRR